MKEVLYSSPCMPDPATPDYVLHVHCVIISMYFDSTHFHNSPRHLFWGGGNLALAIGHAMLMGDVH